MQGTKKLGEVKERFLARSIENQTLWAETERKRTLGIALAQYRAEKGLSQKDVAERAGWDKAFVSRLEGAQGGYPETATLQRYAEACGARLVFGLVDTENLQAARVRVLDIMSRSAGSASVSPVTIEPSDFELFDATDFGKTFEAEI